MDVDRVFECESMQTEEFTELFDDFGIAQPFDVDPGNRPATDERFRLGGVGNLHFDRFTGTIGDHVDRRLRFRWVDDDRARRGTWLSPPHDLRGSSMAMLAAHGVGNLG